MCVGRLRLDVSWATPAVLTGYAEKVPGGGKGKERDRTGNKQEKQGAKVKCGCEQRDVLTVNAPLKLGGLGTSCRFLSSSFHSFSASVNELPLDFHVPDSFGWNFSSA